jgi:hypothetical protein
MDESGAWGIFASVYMVDFSSNFASGDLVAEVRSA